MWVKVDVPDNQDVIGLKCCATGNAISKLGFIVWEPNVKRAELTLVPK